MELRRYLQILRQRRTLIIVTMVVALGIGWLLTPRQASYEASSKIFVGTRQYQVETGAGTDRLSNDLLAALDRVLLTYSIMIDSEPIAAEAIRELGLPLSPAAVVEQASAVAIPSTQLLSITVTNADPTVARDLANALSYAFVRNIQQFEGVDEQAQEGDLPTGLPAYVFEEAKLPVAPQSLDLLQNLILAGVFGLLAAGTLVFVMDYLDVTIRSPEDAERRLDLPVLAVIPIIEDANKLPALVRRSAHAEPAREREPEHA